MRLQTFLLLATVVAIPASFIAAPYPNELVLQHVPTVLGITLLIGSVIWFQPTRLAVGCCLAFLWLHLIGARWIYSFVPYDDVVRILTGRTLTEMFDWKRNHYDRLVHFASGVLGLPPLSNLIQSFCQVRPLAAAVLAMCCVLAVGAAYEVLEWQIAIAFSPAMAESYNGQQGDPWDAQKDLALAWLGAAVTIPLIARWQAGELPTSAERSTR
ncbi:DUF2238 domain-containing protein [Neorhodopirellula pilleata]|uniref:Inner membrane protein YjdF n=1 Tax=Neorhodopirellula pilleata TaxID=2714738 RepID=A0A5C5ZXL1_9BACT|nr:DUF2238 domain-containing protein [Neorhodopirellula pilleata]TWT91876.1 Inner membrane protein YjdF [Neorhodopirellula pilleata]